MILINFETNKNKEFIKFNIKGHADNDNNDFNNKLICAGCSAIVFGIINSLNQLDKNNHKILIKDNLIIIKILKITEENQILLKGLYYSLVTIRNQDKNNIKMQTERQI
ncbi:/ / hypothetical protein / 343835:344152 Reverse [Candidatus Hepatoplasma crinochetorum]|uniref:Ribosomal processing cysteine protease Prp n=1 Tax=Candidatus Hepatoplasma crinochetorum TaxID=295596 RepID=A0A0G7ZKY8_9MOLU|nr:/ / hypothetical protein / 343835:344152 Reverse [Candidatus Hepatoplasma crinochetorum]